MIQNQFWAAAQGEAFQKLTQAIVSGDLQGFLRRPPGPAGELIGAPIRASLR